MQPSAERDNPDEDEEGKREERAELTGRRQGPYLLNRAPVAACWVPQLWSRSRACWCRWSSSHSE
ncbi:hypothetical protein TPA0909_44150 [Streptomyces albus]|nr:hypothetical protein TPA0909_44150 [Streptomyces albus]